MSGFKLEIEPIIKGLIEKEAKAKVALELLGDTVAKDMEAYAKTNRPWTDQTGDARNRLHGDSQNLGSKVRCSISHGVDYGIYLELCNEGKYAILEETVENIGDKALKKLEKIMK